MDAKDIVVLSLAVFIVLASWGYVYLHPDAGAVAYGICVGGTGSIGALLHMLWIRDDKAPDRKCNNGGG
jgi:amino acid permease